MGVNTELLINKLANYFKTESTRNYKNTITESIKDKNFEKYIQSLTVDRLAGGSALKKNSFIDSFRYESGDDK